MNHSLSIRALAVALGVSLSGCYGSAYSSGVPETPVMKSSADALRARYCAEVELAERRADERERRGGSWLVKLGLTLGTAALASVVAAQSTSNPAAHTLKGVAATTGSVGGVAFLGGVVVLGYRYRQHHDQNAATATSSAIAIASLDQKRRANGDQDGELDKQSEKAFQECLKIEHVKVGPASGDAQ